MVVDPHPLFISLATHFRWTALGRPPHEESSLQRLPKVEPVGDPRRGAIHPFPYTADRIGRCVFTEWGGQDKGNNAFQRSPRNSSMTCLWMTHLPPGRLRQGTPQDDWEWPALCGDAWGVGWRPRLWANIFSETGSCRDHECTPGHSSASLSGVPRMHTAIISRMLIADYCAPERPNAKTWILNGSTEYGGQVDAIVGAIVS